MSTEDQRVPIIHHPGGEGWPSPPKTSTAEDRLYGPDFSAPIRLLGQATVATEDAYALLCRASGEDFPPTTERSQVAQEEFWRDVIAEAWMLHERAQAALLNIAKVAIARRKEFRFADQTDIDIDEARL